MAIETRIEETLGRLNVVPVADPLTALAELAGEVLAWKELAAHHVAQLRSPAAVNLFGAEEVRASVLVFERAMDRALHVLTAIAKLNIDSRLAVISEEMGRQMAEVLRAVADDLHFTADQRRDLPEVLRRRLALVEARDDDDAGTG